jgi:hypothetical protein
MDFVKKLKSSIGSADRVRPKARSGPVWKGPEVDGITFSLLSRFIVCRERFRLLVVEGLKPASGFNHRIEYGQMWHICEEMWAQGYEWQGYLADYCGQLMRKYPTDQDNIEHWMNVCSTQFPLYLYYWSEHPDVLQRTPLLQEESFGVPYQLPSGKIVTLRGKWDSVDLIGKGRNAAVYIQENKTKGDVQPEALKKQLHFDLQTMMYMTALYNNPSPDLARLGHYRHADGREYLIGGVRYNVVRRPLSGGKGSIVRGKGTAGAKCGKCKGEGKMPSGARCVKCGGDGRIGGKPPETQDEFYSRLASVIMEEPDNFFMRWRVEISPADVRRFTKECLDPILESLCDWWGWLQETEDCWMNAGGRGAHWRHPFGVYNVLDEGGSSELDEYLHSGSEAGLERTDNLFPELST